jgi:hypothetical protein
MEKELAHLEYLLDKQNFILEELIKSEEIQINSQEKIEDILTEINDRTERLDKTIRNRLKDQDIFPELFNSLSYLRTIIALSSLIHICFLIYLSSQIPH